MEKQHGLAAKFLLVGVIPRCPLWFPGTLLRPAR
jgi:hypothetical protein